MNSTQRILEFIRDNPGTSWRSICDKLGLEERETRFRLEELHRRGHITDDRANILLSAGLDIASIADGMAAEVAAARAPSTVDLLATNIERVRAQLQSFEKVIKEQIQGKPVAEVVAAYRERLRTWLKQGDLPKDEKKFLEEDLDFFDRVVSVPLPGTHPALIDPENAQDHVLVAIGTYNDTVNLSIANGFIPFTVGLSVSTRAAAVKPGRRPPQLIVEPGVPAGIGPEHVKSIADFPIPDPADRIRVRLSETKEYLYQFCTNQMREHSAASILIGESLLPPDMWYNDFHNEYRRPRHVNCMLQARALAQASAAFNCPVAQASRSNSSRRRESTVWTKLVFGIGVSTPAEYVKMTLMGNFDDAIWARISGDREVSEVFTFNEKEAYLKGDDEPKARRVFGLEPSGESLYTSYVAMLHALETSMIFVNYRGRGIRLRYFTAGTDSGKKVEWASSLASLAYRHAVPAPSVQSIAYVNALEEAISHAHMKADEITESVTKRLGIPESSPL